MTKILLNGGFFVEIDPLNYTLKQEYMGKDKLGRDRKGYKVIGYYGRMDKLYQAYLKAFQDIELDGMELTSDEYVKAVRNANEQATRGLADVFRKFEVK